MSVRKRSQKITLVIAWLCYLSAGLCFLAVAYHGIVNDTDNPVFAALLATVIFLISCGIVLHVISNTRLPDFKIDRSKDD